MAGILLVIAGLLMNPRAGSAAESPPLRALAEKRGFLIGAAVAMPLLDGLLHWLDLVWIGRYLGIPGTILILVALVLG